MMKPKLLPLVCGVLLLTFGCASRKETSPATQQPVQSPQATEAASPANTPDAALEKGDPQLARLAAIPVADVPGLGWKSMFNGETLAGWKETQFPGRGELEIKEGLLVMNMGDPFTGITWTNPLPPNAYEISLEAMRFMGTDFFCGLTVPVRDTNCTLIVGGWGGGLVGISSLNGFDASENETTTYRQFVEKKWYSIRFRVRPNRLQAWIDGEKQIDVDTTDLRISLRLGDIERSAPLGIACWQSTAVLRAIQWRPLSEEESSAK